MPQGFPRDAKDIGERIWRRKVRRQAQGWRMPTHTCTGADFFARPLPQVIRAGVARDETSSARPSKKWIGGSHGTLR